MLILQSNYVAGIVDGEGTIGLNEHRNNYYNINITIPNTNLDLLKYIRNVLKD
jgi:intein-encoded DNA endonuclease-like protein